MVGTSSQHKSHYIRSRSASKFFKGAKHAQTHGRPLNLHVTLNLSHTSCTHAQASEAVTGICAKFTRWLSYQSQKAVAQGEAGYGRPTYEAVIEAPNGIHHVHWLVHVPADLQEVFTAKLTVWLSKVCGTITRPAGAIHVQAIDTVMALSRYCMKGVDPHHAKRCYVRPISQGVVLGKRVTISRSLGPTARKQDESASAAKWPAMRPRANDELGTGAST